VKSKLLTAAAAVLFSSFLNFIATDASAGSSSGVSWNRSVTGPNGATLSRVGSCAAGAGCNGTLTITGTTGNQFSRQLSVISNGQGGATGTITLTGPNNTITRTFTVPGDN